MSFEQILGFVSSQNEFLIYGILLVSAFIENIFPPYPGDLVTLAGVYLAGTGDIAYIGVLISVVSGGLAGAITLYYIGKVSGRRFFETGRGRYLVGRNFERVERSFERHGGGILLASRFISGIRSAIAVFAGIINYDLVRMIVLTAISFILWNGLLMGLMIYFKSNWKLIIDLVKQFNMLFLTIAVLLLLGWIARGLWRKRNIK